MKDKTYKRCTWCDIKLPNNKSCFRGGRCRSCANTIERAKHNNDWTEANAIRVVYNGKKRCTTCDELLPLDNKHFDKHTKTPTGFTPECKKCLSVRAKKYREENPEKIKQKKTKYYQKNKEKIKKRVNSNRAAYVRKKRAIDPLYAMKKRLRDNAYRIKTMTGKRKSKTTEQMLGCSYKIAYERLTKNGSIGWDGMEIDHIIPLSWGKSPEELMALSHISNLRLISAEENKDKRDYPPSIKDIPVDIHRDALAVYYREVT